MSEQKRLDRPELMLKEQVTEILNTPIRMFLSREDAERIIKQEHKEQEKAILNLFKAEVDKLTELTDEEIDEKLENDWDGLDSVSLIRFVRDDFKKQLLDLMGE